MTTEQSQRLLEDVRALLAAWEQELTESALESPESLRAALLRQRIAEIAGPP